MQVASRKNSRLNPEAAEAVRNRVQLAPQRNSRLSREVAEAVQSNSAVCTIKNNFPPVLLLGTEAFIPLKIMQEDEVKNECDRKCAILCLF
jgi:hypothetical protein